MKSIKELKKEKRRLEAKRNILQKSIAVLINDDPTAKFQLRREKSEEIMNKNEKIFKVFSGNRIVSHFGWVDMGRSPYNQWEVHLSEDITVDYPKLNLEEACRVAKFLSHPRIVVRVKDIEVEVDPGDL